MLHFIGEQAKRQEAVFNTKLQQFMDQHPIEVQEEGFSLENMSFTQFHDAFIQHTMRKVRFDV